MFMVIGIYLCRLGSRNQNKYDYLKDPPHVWINGIPRGFVQIRGRVIVETPLVSPLTQAPCSFYRTTIAREKPGKPGLYKTIHSESKNREFVIDDGTGKITVMPLGAEYDLPLTYTAEIDLNHPGLIKDASGPSIGQATPPTEDHLLLYLARHGIGKGNTGGPATAIAAQTGGLYRVTEHCLTMGEETSVFGICAICFGPGQAAGRKVICKDKHLPTLLVTKSIEFKASTRLHLIAVASFTFGILMIGLSLASLLLLVYPQFV